MDEKLAQLKGIKKERRKLEKTIERNWNSDKLEESNFVAKKDLSDSELSGNDDGENCLKRKKKQGKKGKCFNKKQKMDSIENKKGVMLNNDPDYNGDNIPNLDKKKVALHRGVTEMKIEHRELDHRPLDQWSIRQVYSKTKTSLEVHNSIQIGLTKSIDGKSTLCKNLENGEVEKEDVLNDTRVNKKPKAVELSKLKIERERANKKVEFFGDDVMEGNFGCLPVDYPLFCELEKEEKVKDETYRNDGRRCIDDTNFLNLDDPPKVSKDYNKDFYRESRGELYLERDCSRGELCVFNTIPSVFPDSIDDAKREEAFVCREWLNPNQLRERDEILELPARRQLCYGDNLLLTNFHYLRNIHNGSESKEIIQDHQVIVNQPNGYAIGDCIPVTLGGGRTTGIVRPFLKFSASRYVYSKMEDPDDSGNLLKCVIEQNLNF